MLIVKFGLTRKVHGQCHYTTDEWEKGIPRFEDWKYVRTELPLTLQQTDGSSCGVFVFHYMAQIMRHGKEALTDYTLLEMESGESLQEHCMELRSHIFATIMNSRDLIE